MSGQVGRVRGGRQRPASPKSDAQLPPRARSWKRREGVGGVKISTKNCRLSLPTSLLITQNKKERLSYFPTKTKVGSQIERGLETKRNNMHLLFVPGKRLDYRKQN